MHANTTYQFLKIWYVVYDERLKVTILTFTKQKTKFNITRACVKLEITLVLFY